MKLLLAEDTQDLNRAVCAILQHEGYEVDTAFDGEEALEMLLQSGYDGVILDIMMPKRDGLSVLSEMRRRHILTPVLMLTAKAEIDDRVAGLDAGADDYLPKPFAMKELLARVRSMTRRRNEYEPAELRFADIVLYTGDMALTAGNTVRLCVKEFELLQTFLSNHDKFLSTETLLERVWRNDDGAAADTVWLYVSYLNGKLRSVGSRVRITGKRGETFGLADGGETV